MSKPLLEIDNLHVHFHKRRLFAADTIYQAVKGASFQIYPGETVGLVGESGSGKSTIARALLKLIAPQSGIIRFGGEDIWQQDQSQELVYRRQVQAIFQDPYGSLNPRHSISTIVGELLTRHRGIPVGKARRHRVIQLLEQVGLSQYYIDRLPHELSGGQRQRVAIARALAVEPKLIICDEPTSALDVSVQSKVINLLRELQSELGVAYLFISHDLAVVRYISHRIGVLYDGELVEIGSAQQVYEQPQHPYSQKLLDAILPVTPP